MTSRILLVRHGPSAHPSLSGWLDRSAVIGWLDGYDDVGIAMESVPPTSLAQSANRSTVIVASDLARAMESAKRLSPAKAIETTPLLRELPLEVPRFGGRLPLIGWAMLIHAAWLRDIVRSRDGYLRAHDRVAPSADWLEARVTSDVSIVAVTHGVMRKYLANELLMRGWRAVGRERGYRPWSAWAFER